MKRYRVHFIYLVIIAALAVASRLKTNELYEQLETARSQAIDAQNSAEKANKSAGEALLRADAAYEEAKKQRKIAEEQIQKAEAALEKCLNQ